MEVARRMKGRGIRFCLVGPKSKGDGGLHGRVQDAHRAGTIHYEGELHGSDLRAAYESAQATFFPSYGEGMPRAMIEAGMAGLCPIAYDINANRDLIPNEDAGFLVEKGSIDQVVSILERLLRDRELLHTKAREYQRRMLKHYSMDTYRFRMDECMDDVFRATADANGTAKDVR